MLFTKRKSKKSSPKDVPLPNFSRCVCDRVFKPESDMETYCSTKCAREDSLRALSGGDTLYRRKALQAQNSEESSAPIFHRSKSQPPKALPKLPKLPQAPTIPSTSERKNHQGYPPPGIRPLPPVPGANSMAERGYGKRYAKGGPAQETDLNESFKFPATRGTTPVSKDTSGFNSPYSASHSHSHVKDLEKTDMLLIGSSTELTHTRTQAPNLSLERARPQGARQRREKVEVRKSASTSFLREAGSLWASVTFDWRELEPIPLPPGVPPTIPLNIRPRTKNAATPNLEGPSQNNSGHRAGKKLRHSRSLHPCKPSFVANVPEDILPENASGNPNDVWRVVMGLRDVEDEDHKVRFLTRQTQRW